MDDEILWNKLIESKTTYQSTRLTKDEYGCLIALVASSRSEDIHTKVGCCIVDANNRIISTGYNGLKPEMNMKIELTLEEFRPIKRFIFLHAEENAVSKIKRGEGHTAYLNINPCANCAKLLAVHEIKEVVFIDSYKNCNNIYKHVFDFYGISHRKLNETEVSNIKQYLIDQSNLL